MEQIEAFLKHWPRAVFCMLLGALIGLAAWMYLPQQYVAIARLDVSIDYNRTGKLDDIEQDRILGVTEDVLHSEDVMDVVFRESSDPDYMSFYKKTRTNRTNERWYLTITDDDPEKISELALLWLDTAYEQLVDSLDHAIRAEALQNELDGLTRCVQNSAPAYYTDCPADMEETGRLIDALAAKIREEKAVSRGLSTAIRPGAKQPRLLEIRSASRSAAADTILGALCGLTVACAIVWLPWNRKQA